MRCLRLAVLGALTVGALAPELCAQPTFSVTDVTIVEGNSGTARAVFTVSLSPATTDTVRAGYNAFAGTSTKPGTATPGVDFGTVSGTVVFPPGTTSRPVDVPVFGDWIAEADETFSLNIWSGPWGGSGEIVARGTGTITNDDPAGLSINDVIVRERVGTTATATFTITLAPASGTPVTVNYATADGTATPGSDYLTGSGLLTFAPGETTKPMSVTVNPDALVEGVETFVVNLSGAAGAGIAHGTATGRILDPPGGGDFNADGNNDLVWRHDASGENAIWHMDGTTLLGGTFTDPQALADMAWRIAGTNDFNADGRPDLLWRHSVSGENVLWYMNGAVLQSGTFLTPASLADVNWRMSGTGDFNLDGHTDILWRKPAGGWGSNVVWFMKGSTLMSGSFLTPLVDLQWRVVATGDYNDDGKVDIVWRHSISGENLIWFMDGVTLTEAALTTTLADTNWKIVGPR